MARPTRRRPIAPRGWADGQPEWRARLIVQAVNSHQELVGLLDRYAYQDEMGGEACGSNLYREARALLSKLEEK